MLYRKIQKEDNIELATVIRDVLTEHGVDKPGTVFTDPTTDALFELFQHPNSEYWVVLDGDRILGGIGMFPTKGLPQGCVELVKLYILKEVRGKGVGRKLMQICINESKSLGFSSVYLETMPELSNAIGLYQEMGFVKLENSLGDSGHFACDLWMLKELKS